MIKTVWKGYLYKNNKSPLIEVLNGETLRVQAYGVGMAKIKGYLTSDSQATDIALIRNSDLAKRKKIITNNIYTADVSGYEYISVESEGFSSIYGTIFGTADTITKSESEEHDYKAIIIIDLEYEELIKICKKDVR